MLSIRSGLRKAAAAAAIHRRVDGRPRKAWMRARAHWAIAVRAASFRGMDGREKTPIRASMLLKCDMRVLRDMVANNVHPAHLALENGAEVGPVTHSPWRGRRP